jgi:hypothetical protein
MEGCIGTGPAGSVQPLQGLRRRSLIRSNALEAFRQSNSTVCAAAAAGTPTLEALQGVVDIWGITGQGIRL